jgi:hypothetical protein
MNGAIVKLAVNLLGPSAQTLLRIFVLTRNPHPEAPIEAEKCPCCAAF